MIKFEKLSGSRIIIFCWDNPLIEGYYLNLLNEIAKHIDIFPMVIATSFLSKLRLIKDGIHAFTYHELINFSLESHSTEQDISRRFSREILKDLSNYDMRVGWKWIPQQNLSDEEFYLYQSSTILKAYNFIWQHFKPHLAMTWNGVTLFQKTLSLLAHTHDVPVLFFERGLLPQTLYVDTEGVNYKSSLAGDKWFNNKIPYSSGKKIAMAKDYCQKIKAEKKSVVDIGEKKSVREIKKKLNIRASDKVILFPMQIEADSNILYFSPHYSKMIEIIKDIQRAIAQFKDIQLIVKLHPEDKNRLNELRSLTNNSTHLLDDVNLYSLFELADLIITVNSTVGLEALLFEKPVIVLGKAIYSEKGFTYDLLEKQNLSNLVKIALEKHNFSKKDFYRFIIYISKHQLFQLNPDQDYFNSRRTIAKKIVELMEKHELISNDIDEIIISKLSENIRFQKIFNKGKTVILGPIDEKLEVIFGKPSEKILHSKEAIKFLLYNLSSKNKPDLVLTAKPLSVKRRILFKLIKSDMKVLLTDNDLKFVKNAAVI